MAEVKKSFIQEFNDFLTKYGVIGLAVAFVGCCYHKTGYSARD